MSEPPLHLLCVEPTFPGRLGGIADWLVRKRGYRCLFLCSRADPRPTWPTAVGHGLDVLLCSVNDGAAVEWSRYLERGLRYAMRYFEALQAHRPAGPRLPPFDLALGRSAGLGSTLFVPVHQPGLPVVSLFDYYYHPQQHDLAEEMPPDTPIAYRHWRRSANAMDLLDLENGVAPWTQTAWQRDLYPPQYRRDFRVLHAGIDVERYRRPTGERRQPRVLAGRSVGADTRVVTFVAQALDRVRGFDRFAALANRLLQARTDVLVVVVGSPIVQRGLDVQFFHQDYPARLLAEQPWFDPERVWWLGQATADVIVEVLQASDLHVYSSRAYPVSRALLEALAAGCVVLAADTAPVRGALSHEQTALLVDPADPDAWAQQALAVLADPAQYAAIAAAASSSAGRYDRSVTMPQLAAWFAERAGQAR